MLDEKMWSGIAARMSWLSFNITEYSQVILNINSIGFEKIIVTSQKKHQAFILLFAIAVFEK